MHNIFHLDLGSHLTYLNLQLAFQGFDSFFDYLDSNQTTINLLKAVFTDFYFDKICQGMTVLTSDNIGTLRDIYGFMGPVILVSNASFNNSDKIFNSIIGKNPIDIIEFINNIEK